MGQYDDWLRKGRNFREGEEPEYFEDAHDNEGRYLKPEERMSQPRYSSRPDGKTFSSQAAPLPDTKQYIAPRFYQNVVVYEPRTPEDVQILIDYLRRREPAIINLDNLEDEVVAQRILDYLSGAEYALGGSVHPIAGNIFLLTPEGVEITVPYDL
ncbi:MAG: cell division protein SepF [Clostridia bacterium]|nr:cell division protein SepF [Clostridia bacterium]